MWVCKVETSREILSMKFYSSSLELSIQQNHIIVYRLGCRSKISITTFFQIWIRSIQIDFIAIFRFERFHTNHMNDSYFERLEFLFWSVTTISPTNKKITQEQPSPFWNTFYFQGFLFFLIWTDSLPYKFQVSTKTIFVIPNMAWSQGQNQYEIIPSISSAVNNEHLLYVYIRRKVHSLGI